MKRYLLFAYDYFCPIGGLHDLVLITDDLNKCREYLKRTSFFNYHIFDTKEFKVIELDNNTENDFENVNLENIEND